MNEEATKYREEIKAVFAKLNSGEISYDEAWVETNTELADDVLRTTFVSILLQCLSKLFGATFGDGTQVIDQLLSGHTDSIVRNGNSLLGVVDVDVNDQIIPQLGNEPLFLESIRGIGEEFSQEDLLVSVQRLGNNIQKLFGLGFELHLLSPWFFSWLCWKAICQGSDHVSGLGWPSQQWEGPESTVDDSCDHNI